MFDGKIRTITHPGTLVLLFLRAACLKASQMNAYNECRKHEAKPRKSNVR